MAKDLRVNENNVLHELEFVLKQIGMCRRPQAIYLLQQLPTPLDMSYTEFLNEIARIINALAK